MGIYTDIYDNYKEYSKDALLKSSVMQGVTSAAELIQSNKLLSRLKVTPNKKMSTITTRLQRRNTADAVKGEIEKGLNSIIATSIEGNRKIDPQLLSRFGDSVLQAYGADEVFNLDLLNREAAMNSASYQRAQEVNTQLYNDDAKRQDQLNMIKSQGEANSLSRFNVGIANIFNNNSRAQAQLFSAKNNAIYSDMMRKLYGFDDKEKRSTLNPFAPIKSATIPIPVATDTPELSRSFYNKPVRETFKPYE